MRQLSNSNVFSPLPISGGLAPHSKVIHGVREFPRESTVDPLRTTRSTKNYYVGRKIEYIQLVVVITEFTEFRSSKAKPMTI